MEDLIGISAERPLVRTLPVQDETVYSDENDISMSMMFGRVQPGDAVGLRRTFLLYLRLMPASATSALIASIRCRSDA